MENTTKNIRIKKTVAVLAALTMLLALACIMAGCGKSKAESQNSEMQTATVEMAIVDDGPMPWDEPGAKLPADYTWQEFEALSGGQQIRFQQTFTEEGGFEAWMEQSQAVQIQLPWEVSGTKLPKEYTWEDFCALNQEQQMAFQQSFETAEGFEGWRERVNPTETEAATEPAVYPWEKSGARQPWEYTWAQFLALSPEQQLAFQSSFQSDTAFAQWEARANPKESTASTVYPWQAPGAKQPINYTWDEFQTLTSEQQIAFQKVFQNTAAFEKWMESAIPKDVQPWERLGAKLPEEYTWEEFLALTSEQQMIFQKAFAQTNGFLDWYEKNVP